MKRFLLLTPLPIVLLACGDGVDLITKDTVENIAGCYEGMETTNDHYIISLDKHCVDIELGLPTTAPSTVVTEPKTTDGTPPTVTDTTVSLAKIEIEFSEDVSGNVALQTEGGDDVGWLGKVEGNKATLELVKGRDLVGGTYVVRGKVSDAAGNSTAVEITFSIASLRPTPLPSTPITPVPTANPGGVEQPLVEEPVVPEEPKVSFKDDILPIFKNHCQVCHRRSNLHFPKAGLDLSSHKGTMKVVDPGWSKQSPIYWRIRADQVPFTRMPLAKPPLSAEQIQLIIDWIDEGAKNN